MQVRLVCGKLAQFACPKEIASYLAMTWWVGMWQLAQFACSKEIASFLAMTWWVGMWQTCKVHCARLS
jgi:hypothetical protein